MKKTLLLCVTLLSVNVLYSMDKNGQQDVAEMIQKMMLDSNANTMQPAITHIDFIPQNASGESWRSWPSGLCREVVANLLKRSCEKKLQKNAELMAQIEKYFPDTSSPKDRFRY